MRWRVFLLIFCVTSYQAIAADRLWYSLSIDGTRVGYAWHDHDPQSDTEIMRVEVVQLRTRVTIEADTRVVRSSATGLPQRIDVESIIGSTRTGWHGVLSADARTLNLAVSTVARLQTLPLAADLVLPDRLGEALEPLWRQQRREIEVHYLEPTAASPTALRAELLPSTVTDPQVTRVRTSETLGRQSHQEIIWFDAGGRTQHRERQFFGATLTWDRCLRDCDAKVEKPFDLMSKLVVPSPYRIPDGALPGPIRYVVSRTDGAVPRIPVTGEQAVVTDSSTAILTVCATCGITEQLAEPQRQHYLQSNPWVQSEHPEIKHFADQYGWGRSRQEIMDKLLTAVRNHMTGSVD